VRVAVAADHAAYELKGHVLEWLRELGHEAVDYGTDSPEPVDYPDVIAPAAQAVARGDCERGIVLGGSGTGEAIVANKVHGIRCVEAADPVTARLGREHNDANVLSMGARIVGPAVARDCVEAFLAGVFEGGRHVPRIEKITALEGAEARAAVTGESDRTGAPGSTSVR
jgi:ribose 5-phosphate isomerase B